MRFFYENRNEIEALCRFVPDHFSLIDSGWSAQRLARGISPLARYICGKQYQHQRFLYSKISEDRVEAFLTDIRTTIACCTSLIYVLALKNN